MTLFHGLGPIASSLAAAGNFDFITSASGTAASSISVENCFSASYSTYLVLRDLLGSSAGENLLVRLRVGGTDASGTDYRYQYILANSTTVSGARATGQTAFFTLGATEGTAFGFSRTFISNPFESVRTTMWTDRGDAQTGNITLASLVSEHDLSTSYTGITVYPTSGTITGTIYVYGVKS